MIKLNRNQLKYIAIIAMVIDHIAWAFVPTVSALGQVMHFVGRLTGPTMAFFIVEGYIHTRSRAKYALRLGIFALIAWVPFSLFETYRWPTQYLGMIFSLFLGLLAVWIWDQARLPYAGKWCLILALVYISQFGDWQYFAVCWPLVLFIYKDNPKMKWAAFYMLCLLVVFWFWNGSRAWMYNLYNCGVFAAGALLQFCYSGEKGSGNAFHKWFFYIFYPAHLLVLWYAKGMIYFQWSLSDIPNILRSL